MVNGTFKSLDGKSYHMDGLCDAPDSSVFRVRFMPQSSGRYTYVVTYQKESFEETYKGDFDARYAGRRGVLHSDPDVSVISFGVEQASSISGTAQRRTI